MARVVNGSHSFLPPTHLSRHLLLALRFDKVLTKLSLSYCCSNRKPRGADFGLLTDSNHLLEDDAPVTHKDDQTSSIVSGSVSGGCEAKYQTSIVDVYATFGVSDTPHSRYLIRHGAYLRITDLVRSELRVADPGVAAFTDGNMAVEGLLPGQTQVQVPAVCCTV